MWEGVTMTDSQSLAGLHTYTHHTQIYTTHRERYRDRQRELGRQRQTERIKDTETE